MSEKPSLAPNFAAPALGQETAQPQQMMAATFREPLAVIIQGEHFVRRGTSVEQLGQILAKTVSPS